MELPKRKVNRLKGYDYSSPGAYFITICTYNKKCLFGKMLNGQMKLNDLGRIVGNAFMHSAKSPIWQNSYHDHIIRGNKDYRRIWEYIDTNVAKWESDCFYADS